MSSDTEALRALAASRPWTADEQGNWVRDTIDALRQAADDLDALKAENERLRAEMKVSES